MRIDSKRGPLSCSVSSAMFFTSYVIWLIMAMLNSSLYAAYLTDGVYLSIRLACYALLVLSLIASKSFAPRELIGLFLCVVLAVSVANTGYMVVLDAIVFVYCSRGQQFRKIAIVTLIVMSILLVFVIVSAAAGVIADYVAITSLRTRHYLGFRYALRPSQYVFLITALYVYVVERRLKLVEASTLFLVNYAIYSFTDSRMLFAISLVLIIVALIPRERLDKLVANRLVGGLLASSFLIVAVASIALAVLYDPAISWMVEFDKYGMLGGRLSLAHDAIENYGITLFGQDIDLAGNGLDAFGNKRVGIAYNYIDNLPVKLLVQYGVVFMALYFALMTAMCWRTWKRGDVIALMILSLIAAHCMLDDLGLYLEYNTFLFLAAQLLTDAGINVEQEEKREVGAARSRRSSATMSFGALVK